MRAGCWRLSDPMQMPFALTAVLAFVLVLGPLVVLHELGHYLAGRLFGVRADAFSVGFGKELWGRTDKRGTRWKLSAIPLGGYVQFAGDMNAAGQADPALQGVDAQALKGTFPGARLWQRAIIVFAGPFANFLIAVAIFAAFAMAYGVRVTPPVIGGFAPQSAAQAAGLQVGDRITAIDGDRVDDFTQIARKVLLYPGKTITIAAERQGKPIVLPVTLASQVEKDGFGGSATKGMLGIASVKPELKPVGFGEALGVGVSDSVAAIKMTAIGLGQIITGDRSTKEMGGPVKIAQYSGQTMSLGWAAMVLFAATISINLAFINLLPIPVLDGGHLAMYAAEAVRRKPLDARSQEWAFRAGLAFVLALVLFVTFNDLASLSGIGS
ncbi:regulator of sigma E protease [Novosphingobium kunmingense]|uniref:Zinc metalloprotease n=2 Tax=Novosphingobium kunmingense TaxID=1211806 RepID=A0A2N0I396_9SPHN|nr:regulator of sigma E protease [Novosphingobium kunmingense]